jgi:phage terminase small subunit
VLTTFEANFIQEYKACGNAVKALKAAGFKAKSDNYARLKAHRIMNKPEIKSILERHNDNLDIALITPVITKLITNDTVKTINLPNKEEYANTAWERSSDESKLKEETKFKYFENAGRVLGHVKNEEAVNVNIISADTLESMRATLMSRGKVVNISSAQASSIIPPPVNTIDISASQQSSDTASQHDSITAEKKLDSTDEGGIETPSHP